MRLINARVTIDKERSERLEISKRLFIDGAMGSPYRYAIFNTKGYASLLIKLCNKALPLIDPPLLMGNRPSYLILPPQHIILIESPRKPQSEDPAPYIDELM